MLENDFFPTFLNSNKQKKIEILSVLSKLKQFRFNMDLFYGPRSIVTDIRVSDIADT